MYEERGQKMLRCAGTQHHKRIELLMMRTKSPQESVYKYAEELSQRKYGLIYMTPTSDSSGTELKQFVVLKVDLFTKVVVGSEKGTDNQSSTHFLGLKAGIEFWWKMKMAAFLFRFAFSAACCCVEVCASFTSVYIVEYI
mmetsp:Transcript_23686/g.65754  ORF Transcript_23686/g.65754 Transcript_23686/m.65754 type:complete len:140 (+) Transcript_23686:343-762(+)